MDSTVHLQYKYIFNMNMYGLLSQNIKMRTYFLLPPRILGNLRHLNELGHATAFSSSFLICFEFTLHVFGLR